MTNRRSYSQLSHQPAWLLLDDDLNVVASVRAPTSVHARVVFKRHGMRARYLIPARSYDRVRSRKPTAATPQLGSHGRHPKRSHN